MALAIAHKDYDVRGGGERLAEELADTFDAPLIVGRRDPENVPERDDLEVVELEKSKLSAWAIDRGGPWRAFAYQNVWMRPDELVDYDTVVLSGNEPLWYVPRDEQTIVAYTHSTPRFQYDLFHEGEGHINRLYNYVTRVLYEHNTRRPDLYVANSDLVARRIRRYWNIPADQIRVVYPPVDVHNYDPDLADTSDRAVYVYVGRLCGHKRVDEVVEAFADMPDRELLIAGKGPARDELERKAADNVEFLGYVSEERKRELLAGAYGFIFPGANEDFGIAPIEAMAAGTPVIGVDEGFTKYQVLEGKNGVLYDRGALGPALDRYEREGVSWDADRIHQFAQRFGVDRFREGMREAVAEAEARSTVIPPWEAELEDVDGPAHEPIDRPLVADGGVDTSDSELSSSGDFGEHPPVCRYCGGFIEVIDQDCPALDDGVCAP